MLLYHLLIHTHLPGHLNFPKYCNYNMKFSSACVAAFGAAVVSAATPKDQALDTGIVTMGMLYLTRLN